jgi:hypothetical protein
MVIWPHPFREKRCKRNDFRVTDFVLFDDAGTRNALVHEPVSSSGSAEVGEIGERCALSCQRAIGHEGLWNANGPKPFDFDVRGRPCIRLDGLSLNASSRSDIPATYPQSSRSGVCLRRPRCGVLATRSCLRPRHDGRSKASATTASGCGSKQGDRRETRDHQTVHGKPPFVESLSPFLINSNRDARM